MSLSIVKQQPGHGFSTEHFGLVNARGEVVSRLGTRPEAEVMKLFLEAKEAEFQRYA